MKHSIFRDTETEGLAAVVAAAVASIIITWWRFGRRKP
jgi:hypothetical protein